MAAVPPAPGADPPRASPTYGRLLVIALAVGALQLVPFLDTVPGLHGDEAWAGLRARAIASGQTSVYGLTAYTGPVHHYLLLPLLGTLGYHVWALRSLTVLASLLSVWLLFLNVRRLFDAQLAGLAALVLASMPWFALYGRTATEHFTLNPVLALTASWCFLRAVDAGDWRRHVLAGASGLLLALGTWNHLIFAPVPLVLGIAAFEYALRRRCPSLPLGLVCGFLVGASPRLIALVAEPEANRTGLSTYAESAIGGWWARLAESPAVFGAVLHGDLLYQRYTGEVVWPTPPIAPPLLAAAIVALAGRLLRRGEPHPGRIRRLGAGSALFALLTLSLAPETADRHFLLILYVAVVFIALLFQLLLSSPVPTTLCGAAFVTFLALNLSRTVLNFHLAHLYSGGKPSILWLGSKLETSSHFIRTDLLYEQLVARGVQDVYAEFFIAFPLTFYDLDRHQFRRVIVADNTPPPPSAERTSAFLVSYREGPNRISPYGYGARELGTFRQFEISGFSAGPSVAAPN